MGDDLWKNRQKAIHDNVALNYLHSYFERGNIGHFRVHYSMQELCSQSAFLVAFCNNIFVLLLIFIDFLL